MRKQKPFVCHRLHWALLLYPPMTLDKIRVNCCVDYDENYITRVMGLLVALGWVTEVKPGQWVLVGDPPADLFMATVDTFEWVPEWRDTPLNPWQDALRYIPKKRLSYGKTKGLS